MWITRNNDAQTVSYVSIGLACRSSSAGTWLESPSSYMQVHVQVFLLGTTSIQNPAVWWGSSALPGAYTWHVGNKYKEGGSILYGCRGVPRIFGGGGMPRSAKQANKPNKRATELKPLTCAHQGSMFRPYYSVCFVESSIFTTLV